jgi:hypothetical protein
MTSPAEVVVAFDDDRAVAVGQEQQAHQLSGRARPATTTSSLAVCKRSAARARELATVMIGAVRENGSAAIDAMTLAEWRRHTFAIYREVREALSPAAAHAIRRAAV